MLVVCFVDGIKRRTVKFYISNCRHNDEPLSSLPAARRDVDVGRSGDNVMPLGKP